MPPRGGVTWGHFLLGYVSLASQSPYPSIVYFWSILWPIIEPNVPFIKSTPSPWENHRNANYFWQLSEACAINLSCKVVAVKIFYLPPRMRGIALIKWIPQQISMSAPATRVWTAVLAQTMRTDTVAAVNLGLQEVSVNKASSLIFLKKLVHI